jgi:hypothetical protein
VTAKQPVHQHHLIHHLLALHIFSSTKHVIDMIPNSILCSNCLMIDLSA